MNSRNSNQHKYSNAGEQAGRVISEFMSMADDFSKRFEKEFTAKDRSSRSSGFGSDNRPNDESEHREKTSSSASNTNAGKDHPGRDYSGRRESMDHEWRDAGEYLRALREAAGYSIDEFAKAINRHDAASKIKSVEQGRDTFPQDWLDQMSDLLKQNDPVYFFARLRDLYDTNNSTTDTVDDGDAANVETVAGDSSARSRVTGLSVAKQRRLELQNIFSDGQLEGLSDSQFEELLAFVEINFRSVLQLVNKK